mgnify:CR=1 FL=1
MTEEVPITESQPRLTSYANDYELTKSMSEEVVSDYVKKGLSCIILNLTRVYGPGLNTYSNGLNKIILKKHNVLKINILKIKPFSFFETTLKNNGV